MASQMRVYVLLGAVLVAVVWLEKTASAQSMDVYTYCSIGYWNGNVSGECTGYDNSWGCFHDDYSILGYLYSPTRSAPIGGLGWSYGGGYLPWQHEAGSWSLSAGFRVNCSCILDYWEFPFDIQEPINPTVTLDPSGTYGVPQNSGDVIITATVNPPEFGQDLNWNATGGTQGDTNLQWRVGTTDLGEVSVTASIGNSQATTIVQVWAIPSGETTSTSNWGTQGTQAETVHAFRMTLLGGDFEGRRVREENAQPAFDECQAKFPNMVVPAATGVTGGPPPDGWWDVDSDNQWYPDGVGWDTGAVIFYRNAGAAPCSAYVYQRMLIDVPAGTPGEEEYVTNTLIGTIGNTTVRSVRAGVEVWKFWP